jgi:2-polyprenyl-6-methoxyphenol hydroxylase-like FAD-dependent oxidoreductase
VNIIAVFGCVEITVMLPQPTLLIEQDLQLIHAFERNGHRTKNGSKTKGRMIQTMGRAHAIKGAHKAIVPGQRRYNWVWYRNATEARRTDLLTDRDGRQRTSSVPPGLISAAAETDLRQAAVRDLPPSFRVLVAATHEPFLQSIEDLSVRQMAFGRVALIGDAAFIPRPHTAASTAKAAANALGLANALRRDSDIVAALRGWEPDQIQYGLHLRRQGTAFGNRSQKSYPELVNI